MNYDQFLAAKKLVDRPTGLDTIPELNDHLFDFQRDIVAWSLRRGRSAIFADCGLGKTLMQLEWARHVPGRVLILAPLAVAVAQVLIAGGVAEECSPPRRKPENKSFSPLTPRALRPTISAYRGRTTTAQETDHEHQRSAPDPPDM